MSKLDVNRREFLKITAGAGAALASPTSGDAAVSSEMIGIPSTMILMTVFAGLTVLLASIGIFG